MGKYAVLKDFVVISIAEVSEEEVKALIANHEMVIDVSNVVPTPCVGYILNGNKLEIPANYSDREKFEIELNSRKSDFGTKLARSAVDRIGARNKILNKSGAQVAALLTQLMSIKSLLETGALGTARAMSVSLKAGYTEYGDIFDLVINEINLFEQSFGL